jgi:hypothetical protein
VSEPSTQAPAPDRAGPDRPLASALWLFGIATVAVIVCVRLGTLIPVVRDNVGALVAIVFLYVPVAWCARRDQDIADYGFSWRPLRRGLAFGVGTPLIVFPVFAVGFVLFYELVCGGPLADVAPPGFCARFGGYQAMRAPALDMAFAENALVQLIVVALPEELFFRGLLHQLCERALPPKRRVLGGGIGWALVISSALFAVGHVAVDLDPRRFAVFFPGMLFGWMRSATGSILAGTIAHASSNLFIDVLQRMFFR